MQSGISRPSTRPNRIEVNNFCLETTDPKEINAFTVAMIEEFMDQTGYYVTDKQTIAACKVIKVYSCYQMIPMWIRQIELAVPSVMEPGIRFSIEVLSSQSSEFSTYVSGYIASDGTLWQEESGRNRFLQVKGANSLKPAFTRIS